MKVDREVTIRKIIKEMDKPALLTTDELIKRLQTNSVRLKQLEARIEGILSFVGDCDADFGRGIAFAVRKILGEKESAEEAEKGDR